jgi:hypothetical protein
MVWYGMKGNTKMQQRSYPIVVDDITPSTVVLVGLVINATPTIAAKVEHRKAQREYATNDEHRMLYTPTDGDKILNNQCQGIPLSIQLPSLIDNYMGAYGSLIGHFIIASDLIPIIIGMPIMFILFPLIIIDHCMFAP